VRNKRETIRVNLTPLEAGAAFMALSNYTLQCGPWKQNAQSRAASKLKLAIIADKERKKRREEERLRKFDAGWYEKQT